MKLAHTLHECADLERRIAGFYRQFAGLWAADPEVGPMWAQMADEELSHAEALEELANLVVPSRRRERIDREALAQLRGYVTGTGRILGHITLDDAFRTALELETLELHQIYLHVAERARDDATLPPEALTRCLSRLKSHEAPLLETIARRARADDLHERIAEFRGKIG